MIWWWWAGESKPRRRRKKNKGEESSLSGAKKRKLSQEQVDLLELNFGNEHKLESEKKDRLASELGLDPRQVAVWFQNRRARWKNKKLEEEYSKLKSVHEGVVLEKCRLESEVDVSLFSFQEKLKSFQLQLLLEFIFSIHFTKKYNNSQSVKNKIGRAHVWTPVT